MVWHTNPQIFLALFSIKGLFLIVPPSLFSTFSLVPQDFGYFLNRQGVGQAEKVHCFAGQDPVPGDTFARYSPTSQHLIWHGHEDVWKEGVSESTEHIARSLSSALHGEKCKPIVPEIGSDVFGGCKTSSATARSSPNLCWSRGKVFCFQHINYCCSCW